MRPRLLRLWLRKSIEDHAEDSTHVVKLRICHWSFRRFKNLEVFLLNISLIEKFALILF